jgi:nitroreductase
MNFFDVVENRRSIRKFGPEVVPTEVMDNALHAALLAPNSSNLQLWQFFLIQDENKKKQMIENCLNQSGARTAKEFLVVVASPSLWKKTSQEILKQPISPNAEKLFKDYYQKIVPMTYGFQLLAPLKWFIFNVIGLFRPIMRRPWSWKDREEVCIKSAALACENFMLAITAQGFDTLPMEGFDECRIKKLLNLKFSDRVVMVITVGKRIPGSEWGPRFRCDPAWFIHKV